MIRKSTKQSSFLDTNYICERLVPQDSFYRKFRELVTPLIRDEHFEDMYCKDNGRPAISPSRLACAMILQMYQDLSDREMEEACMYDIRIKHALGLEIDERPFDHSSLNDFRQRLIDNGQEKLVFNKILNHLIEEGLIKRNEMQRIDATHIVGKDWVLIQEADGGITGVRSSSNTKPSGRKFLALELKNFQDAKHYSEWLFDYYYHYWGCLRIRTKSYAKA